MKRFPSGVLISVHTLTGPLTQLGRSGLYAQSRERGRDEGTPQLPGENGMSLLPLNWGSEKPVLFLLPVTPIHPIPCVGKTG